MNKDCQTLEKNPQNTHTHTHTHTHKQTNEVKTLSIFCGKFQRFDNLLYLKALSLGHSIRRLHLLLKGKPFPQKGVLSIYVSKLRRVVRLKFWSTVECRVNPSLVSSIENRKIFIQFQIGQEMALFLKFETLKRSAPTKISLWWAVFFYKYENFDIIYDILHKPTIF